MLPGWSVRRRRLTPEPCSSSARRSAALRALCATHGHCSRARRRRPAPSPLLCALAAPQDQEAQVARKKRRNVTKAATRSVAGASVEVIQKKKAEKPEARKASREAALR